MQYQIQPMDMSGAVLGERKQTLFVITQKEDAEFYTAHLTTDPFLFKSNLSCSFAFIIL